MYFRHWDHDFAQAASKMISGLQYYIKAAKLDIGGQQGQRWCLGRRHVLIGASGLAWMRNKRGMLVDLPLVIQTPQSFSDCGHIFP